MMWKYLFKSAPKARETVSRPDEADIRALLMCDGFRTIREPDKKTARASDAPTSAEALITAARSVS